MLSRWYENIPGPNRLVEISTSLSEEDAFNMVNAWSKELLTPGLDPKRLGGISESLISSHWNQACRKSHHLHQWLLSSICVASFLTQRALLVCSTIVQRDLDSVVSQKNRSAGLIHDDLTSLVIDFESDLSAHLLPAEDFVCRVSPVSRKLKWTILCFQYYLSA